MPNPAPCACTCARRDGTRVFATATTNLLRATTEALSAVIGGCDRLTVELFGFDEHLALNIQRILREEAHRTQWLYSCWMSDHIEALTDSIAREAWKLFQQVESEGGYAKALASGSIGKALAAPRAARDKAMSSRRRVLAGVNNYPNLTEKKSETEALPQPGPLPQYRIAEPFEKSGSAPSSMPSPPGYTRRCFC